MPSRYQTLDRAAVREVVVRDLFGGRGSRSESFGLSVELLPVRWDAAGNPEAVPPGPSPKGTPSEQLGLTDLLVRWRGVDEVDVRAPAAVTPGRGERGRLSFGAGGQVRFDSAVTATPAAAFEQVTKGLDSLTEHLAGEGVDLVGLGANPWHTPDRVGFHGRNQALVCLDQAITRGGETGRRALLLSAGTRVRLGFCGPVIQPMRWRAAQLAAPLFSAIFASSPMQDGGHEGTKCVRARARRIAEPSRAGFPGTFVADPTSDAIEAYLAFALAARVVGIPDGEQWAPQPAGLTFARWMDDGVAGRYPDEDDWSAHLATLLPEVLPAGGLELDSADALPRAFWSVPLTLWTALLCDSEVVTDVIDVLGPTAERLDERWDTAGRGALLDPELREQASWLFGRGADALLRLPESWVTEEMLGAFVAYGKRYTQRGLSPADEVLDVFLERGCFGRDQWVALDERARRVAGTSLACGQR